MTKDMMDRDLDHLNSFPGREKEKIMHAIMQQPAADEHVCYGEHCYENMVTRLRAKGYQLIDLDLQEAAFAAVWYRKARSWLGLRVSEHAAMLVWETTDNGEQTTWREWRLQPAPRRNADFQP